MAWALATAASCEAPPAPDAQTTNIELRQTDDPALWHVSYTFPRAVEMAVFPRNSVLYRAAKWRFDDEKFAIVLQPALDEQGRPSTAHAPREAVRRLDGRPFSGFSASIPTLFDTWPNEYPQNYSFSDGSVLFYTGHLVIEPDDAGNARHRLNLVAAGAGHVVVRGRRQSAKMQVTDPGDNGVFAYFGEIEPVMEANFAGVIDPGLPRWLAADLAEHLPAAFDTYAARLGTGPVRIPTVFFNFLPGESRVMHFKGGALNDATFSLSIVGNGWQSPPPDMRRAVPMHIAHEAAHLWNLRLGSGDRVGSWMHEGGAELLSWLALRATGYLSIKDYDDLVCNAARECERELGGRALHTAEQGGDMRLSYSCGAVIANAIDQAARMAAEPATLFEVTAMAIAAVAPAQANTVERYLDVVAQVTANDALREAIDNFVAGAEAVAARDALLSFAPPCH